MIRLPSVSVTQTVKMHAHPSAASAGLITKGEGDGDAGGGRVRRVSGGLNRLCVSGDGEWVAGCDMGGHVTTWRMSPAPSQLEEDEGRCVGVPALPGGVTAMRFRGSGSELVLVTACNTLYTFNPANTKLIKVVEEEGVGAAAGAAGTKTKSLPCSFRTLPHHCHSMTFNPRKPSSLILWGHSFLCHVDLDKPLPRQGAACEPETASEAGESGQIPPDTPHIPTHKSSKKRARRVVEEGGAAGGAAARGGGGEAVAEASAGGKFSVVTKYAPLLCAEFLTGHNLLVVERSLPPSPHQPHHHPTPTSPTLPLSLSL